jgi:xanthine dehydrogenase accessory factor
VAGYLALMPSYQDQLTTGEFDELVHYVASLSERHAPSAKLDNATAAVNATAPPVELTTDPVCKMQVRASDDTLHAAVAGKSYYFCSPSCRDQFVKNPARYLAAP